MRRLVGITGPPAPVRVACCVAVAVVLALGASPSVGAARGASGSAVPAVPPIPVPVVTFVISPAEGGPGTVVQVSGTGCIEGPGEFSSGAPAQIAGIFLRYVADGFGGPFDPAFDQEFPVRPDGAWSGDFVVPTAARPGAYEMSQTCASGDILFPVNERQPFTVLDRPAGALDVSPGSGLVGTAAMVTGRNCATAAGALATAMVWMTDANGVGVASVTVPVSADGSFSAQLTIDGGAAVGGATVQARCSNATQTLVTASAAFTIEAPAVTVSEPLPEVVLPVAPIRPVVASPAFTG